MAADPFCQCCERAVAVTPLPIFNRAGLSEIAYRIGTFSSFREAMLELDRARSGARGADDAREQRLCHHALRTLRRGR